jgi:hypothetical protein
VAVNTVRHIESERAGRLHDRDVAWRRRLLRAAGLPEELSRAVAASHEHDVHDVLGLLQRGCPPATALRITARDDHGPGG